MMIYIQGENTLIPLTLDLSNYYTKEEIREVIANIDLSPYALVADVEANKIITDTHIANTNIHITASERESWNSKEAKITGIAGQFVVIGDDGNVTTKTIPCAEEASF